MILVHAAFAAALALSILAAPAAVEAQPVRSTPIVGVLTPHLLDPGFPALREGLRELGYEDGRNLRLVIRSADTRLERLPGLAVDLVQMKPDVIVSVNTPGTRAAINATKDIPIVMAIVGNPVATGFVSSLSHPGGNVTGVSNLTGELAAKRLQIAKEAIPTVKRVAVIFNADDAVTGPQIRDTEQAAPHVGVDVRFFAVRAPADLTSAFKSLTRWHADVVLWLAGQVDPFMEPTIDLAAKRRLPTIFPGQSAAKAGGLIVYAADHSELYRRVAMYVDKILRGAKPGDLPVEQPRKFELFVNMKTAKALGITIPAALLLRADHVIE